MKIRALVPFSTGTITMEQYEVKEVGDAIGASLIADGLAVQINGLPAVSASDNGKVATVVDGAWGAQQKKYVVTLTPTAADYSGTMDKTVAEINAAYEAGQEIWFYFAIPNLGAYEFRCDTVGRIEGYTYPSFNGGMYYNNQLMRTCTSVTNDGTRQAYFTELYALTPAT